MDKSFMFSLKWWVLEEIPKSTRDPFWQRWKLCKQTGRWGEAGNEILTILDILVSAATCTKGIDSNWILLSQKLVKLYRKWAGNPSCQNPAFWLADGLSRAKPNWFGTSLEVWWLGLCAPSVGGLGSIPSQGTRSYMQQLRPSAAK